MNTATRLSLALVTALCVAGAPALAAPPPGGTPARGDTSLRKEERAGKREEIRARVQQKVKTYVTVELSSRLGLDEKKSLRLADVVAAQMERKRAHREEMRAEMKKLQELVDQKAPDAQVKAQLDVVVKKRATGEDTQQFLKDTSAFLTVQEQAKLALAMPEVMGGVKRMMHETRRELRGEMGGRGEGRRGRFER